MPFVIAMIVALAIITFVPGDRALAAAPDGLQGNLALALVSPCGSSVGAFVSRARERTRSFTAPMGEPLDTLTLRQKQFVVEQLAAFGSPGEVAKGLLEQFGVTVAPHVVAAYDPTRRAGQRCPALWKRRFEEAREDMIHGTPSPLASRSVRLQQREKMFRRAIEQEDFLLANRILDSIAREVGGDTSLLEKRLEITDEQRANAAAAFIRKWRWKAEGCGRARRRKRPHGTAIRSPSSWRCSAPRRRSREAAARSRSSRSEE